jgi:hypothetical protein
VNPSGPADSLLGAPAAEQADSASIESGDLFAGKTALKRSPAAKRRLAPELTAARVLCNQLRRKRALPEKKRIVHLICLNLLAVLNRPSQQA